MKLIMESWKGFLKETSDEPAEDPSHHVDDVKNASWMRFGRGTVNADGSTFILYHDGSDKQGADATTVFLRGVLGDHKYLLYDGNGDIIGFAQEFRADEDGMPLWQPHFHAPKSGYPPGTDHVTFEEKNNWMKGFVKDILKLPPPGK